MQILGSIIIPIVILAVTVLMYLRSNPKKVIEYQIRVLPLMHSSDSLPSGVEVSAGGKRLMNPQLLEVSIQAAGRSDVDSRDFDAGRPLVFELGSEAEPFDDDPSSERFQIRGTSLLFQPTVIHAKQGTYVAKILCDGKLEPHLAKPHPLINTRIRKVSEAYVGKRKTAWDVAANAMLILALVALFAQGILRTLGLGL